jgi:hypothetical protein
MPEHAAVSVVRQPVLGCTGPRTITAANTFFEHGAASVNEDVNNALTGHIGVASVARS